MHHRTVFQVAAQIDVLFGEQVVEREDLVGQLTGQVVVDGLGDDGLAFEFVEFEDVGHERVESFGRGDDGPYAFLALGLVHIHVTHHGRVILDDGQRIADFVAHIGDEVVFHGFDAAQFLDHGIEIGEHLISRIPKGLRTFSWR